MAIWYKVQKAWPVPAVKGTLWENLACKPSWTRVSEMKEDPHKQVADKLIWATQFYKLGFAEVPLKFQDFGGVWKSDFELWCVAPFVLQLAWSSRFLLSFERNREHAATTFFFC